MIDFHITRLERSHLSEAARVLARAFQEDPLFSFVVPNAADRRRWLPVFEQQLLRNTQPLGHSYIAQTADQQIVAVMGVTPPGRYPHPLWSDLRLVLHSVLRPTPWCPNLRKLLPIRRYGEVFQQMHYPHPHWYLDVIGVDPAYHRQGIGQRLMRHLVDVSQVSELPIWLETQTAANVPYYESFGFEATEHHHPVPGGPPTWGMLRSTC